jgi:hypothetical protein
LPELGDASEVAISKSAEERVASVYAVLTENLMGRNILLDFCRQLYLEFLKITPKCSSHLQKTYFMRTFMSGALGLEGPRRPLQTTVHLDLDPQPYLMGERGNNSQQPAASRTKRQAKHHTMTLTQKKTCC